MRPDAPYFIILPCLKVDEFACQEDSAATQIELSVHASC